MITYYDMFGMPISMERWAQLHGQPKHVAEDFLTIRGEKFRISTVWLGLDHNFMPGGPPLIFETMIFSATDKSYADIYCVRYSTRQQALVGHRRAKRWLREEIREALRELHETRRPLIHKGKKPKVLASA